LWNARVQDTRVDEALLESWEERVIDAGAKIICSRRRYVQEIEARLPIGLFGDEKVQLEYGNAASDELAEVAADLRRRLMARRPSDLKNAATSVGPHRDDLEIRLAGKRLADFGSAGQQRSGLVALYLAQMERHKEEFGFYPILLMDDVEAELDPERLKSMLEHLAPRTQLFLTTAKEAILPRLDGSVRRFEIMGGGIKNVAEM
jgi:DNA replication and repair protein RecF